MRGGGTSGEDAERMNPAPPRPYGKTIAILIVVAVVLVIVLIALLADEDAGGVLFGILMVLAAATIVWSISEVAAGKGYVSSPGQRLGWVLFALFLTIPALIVALILQPRRPT